MRIPYKLLILCILVLLSFLDCVQSHFWGIKVEEIRSSLACGDYSFLKHVDFSTYDINEILGYGPGAAYYFSYIAADIELYELSEQFLRLEWEKGTSPWKEEAGLELLTLFLNEERYEDALELANDYLKQFSDSRNSEKVKRIYVEAEYWQKNDDQVLALLDEYYLKQAQLDYIEEDPELFLFKAVSSYRLGLADWEQDFKNLFYKVKTAWLHKRAYSFLLLEEDRLKAFTEAEANLFQAKDLAAMGVYDQAIPLFERALALFDKNTLSGTTIIYDYGNSCIKGSTQKEQAEILEKLALQLDSEERSTAFEMAARIYLNLTDLNMAQMLFEKVLSESEDNLQKKRLCWYLINTAIKEESPKALDYFIKYIKDWDDPYYFSDVLEAYISTCILQMDWAKLLDLYELLKSYGPDDIISQLSYIIARCISLGYIKSSSHNNDSFVQELLKDSLGKDAGGYYKLLVNSFLQGKPILPNMGKDKIKRDFKLSEIERMIFGFFDYGLYINGYNKLSRNSDFIQTAVFFRIAEIFYNNKYFFQAIQALNLVKNREDAEFSKNDFKYLYPLAYSSYLQEVTNKYNLNMNIFFALVRQESAFDNQVISDAGAVGLCQLMPETGAEIALRIGIDDPDFTEPAQNLTIGAFYFSSLIERFKSIPRALASYNAGPTRVRRWEGKAGQLPDDLFIEAIPYSQTRNFVKLICMATVYYNCLYGHCSSTDVIKEFFKD